MYMLDFEYFISHRDFEQNENELIEQSCQAYVTEL